MCTSLPKPYSRLACVFNQHHKAIQKFKYLTVCAVHFFVEMIKIRQTSRQADKQTSRQADKQTNRQKDKQTNRQTFCKFILV